VASPQTITLRRDGFDVRLQVPAGWKARMNGSLVEVDAPGSVAFLRVQVAKTPMSISQIAKGFAADELRKLRKQDPKAFVSRRSVKVGGNPAELVEERYRGTWVDEKTEIVRVIYFMKSKGTAYEFDCGTTAASFKTMASTFATSISSVHFLGLGGPSA